LKDWLSLSNKKHGKNHIKNYEMALK